MGSISIELLRVFSDDELEEDGAKLDCADCSSEEELPPPPQPQIIKDTIASTHEEYLIFSNSSKLSS